MNIAIDTMECKAKLCRKVTPHLKVGNLWRLSKKYSKALKGEHPCKDTNFPSSAVLSSFLRRRDKEEVSTCSGIYYKPSLCLSPLARERELVFPGKYVVENSLRFIQLGFFDSLLRFRLGRATRT